MPIPMLAPRTLSRFTGTLVLSLSLAASAARPAQAQQATMQEKSESHALFERAMVEYKASRFKEALPLFQGSNQLDAGVGTLMYMGECFAQLGQSASAWGAFKEAATLAVKLGDKREQVALERAAAVEKTLSQMTIEVPPEARVEGLEIRRDGKVVPSALWGTSMPIDPGEHTVEASAPGRKAASLKQNVGVGGAKVVFAVKPLVAEPGAGKAEPTKRPLDTGRSGSTRDREQREPGPAREASPWRTVGFVAGGVGIAAGVVGTIVGVGAASKGGQAQTDRDLDAYNSAKGTYTAGMVTLGVGGALLVGGIVLVVMNPSASEPTAGVRVVPQVGSSSGGVVLSGSW
jgi:hypothetical protein